MTAADSVLQAFGGGPLSGDDWVQVVFLDESGTGNLEQDPVLVVAGVIVDANKTWVGLCQRLKQLLHDSVPAGVDRPQFLHAKDIYHGTKEFHRDQWSEKARYSLLDDLARLPLEFQIPVVWGGCDRRGLSQRFPDLARADQDKSAYAIAGSVCMMQVERWMRENTPSHEVASMFFEDGHSGKRMVKEAHRYLTGGDVAKDHPVEAARYLPLSRIIDAPSFQEKNDATALQLADFCAFALKRAQAKARFGERFAKPFASQCLALRRE